MIAERLRKLGHQVILTTREHPDTKNVMLLLKEPFEIVGKYDPRSLSTRLKASIERELQFCEMFKHDPPDFAISHGSVELCRIAFGFGVKNICTGDTIYTKANWLVVPMTDILVTSKAIPKRAYQRFGTKEIVQFDGVDEVAWTHIDRPHQEERYKHPLIVVRQSEFKASYMKGKDVTLEIAKQLVSLGNVLFLPRYERKKIEGLIIPEEFVDSLSLAREADLFVGIGGTIAREAALQGTPTIVIPALGRSYVNEYISKKGFPLFKVKPSDVFKYAKKYLGKRVNVYRIFATLENPIDIIEGLVQTSIKQGD